MSRTMLVVGLWLSAACCYAGDAPLDGPLSAGDAPKSCQLEPGLKIELVAAEPLVVAPVAMAFDENGRLFVAENRGYPSGGKNGEPLGRIAMLEDTDADGRMDKRTDFATGLTFPNGVLPWDGGLIVTCAPDILFLKDNNGDGKADERRVLFTGFATTGSTQLRCSHPTLSLDGWIYVTGGLSGGKVTCPAHPDRPPVEFKKADFRFRPDLSEYEAADGGGQFGLSFDDFGRRFIRYNRVQVQHVVLSSKVLRRNPHLAFSETVENCPADLAPEPLAGHGRAARLYPISTNVTTADSHAGTFTAACGLHIFRGTGLPERFRGCAFSCDPTGNLIHVDRLEPNGATFKALPLLDKREFLASTDNWFRPVFLTSGPNGALYVCDMYRKTIEHPDYLPVEIRKHTDFESGREMGRIWRITSERHEPKSEDSLHRADPSVLVAALHSKDGWRRSTAHRLLLARADNQAEAQLNALAIDSLAAPEAVLAALHLLQHRDALPDSILTTCLNRPEAGVREHVLELIEPRLPPAQGERVNEWIGILFQASLRADDPRVRMRLALCYGSIRLAEDPVPDGPNPAPQLNGPRPPQASSHLIALLRPQADRWERAALWSAIAGREAKVAKELIGSGPAASQFDSQTWRELGRLWVLSDKGNAAAILGLALEKPLPPAQMQPLVTGIAEGWRRRNPAATGSVFTALIAENDRTTRRRLDAMLVRAAEIARNRTIPANERVDALSLLSYGASEKTDSLLEALLAPEEPDAVQRAAVRSLGVTTTAHEVLLKEDRFAACSPAMREEILAVVMAQTPASTALLDALEANRISLATLDALRRRQLREHRDPAIKARAAKLFEAVTGDRAKVYEELKSVAEMPGEAAKGRAVFAKNCASCHRLDREGFAVGPDLFGIRNQPKAAILLHILVPEQEITQGFTAYMAETKDGRVFVGLLAGETETSLTIRQPLGKEETILRANLERLAASPLSLMPQGVEKTLSKQDFADLLAYLKGEK